MLFGLLKKRKSDVKIKTEIVLTQVEVETAIEEFVRAKKLPGIGDNDEFAFVPMISCGGLSINGYRVTTVREPKGD